jgi:hypothetical protein
MIDMRKKSYKFELDTELAELFEKYCAEAGVTPQAVMEDLVIEMIEDFYLIDDDQR